jgi:hypothetical protein
MRRDGEITRREESKGEGGKREKMEITMKEESKGEHNR